MSSNVLKGPTARHKAFRMERAASPARGCSRGFGGAATNKQKWPSRRGGTAIFRMMGPSCPACPVCTEFGITRFPHARICLLVL